WSRPVGVRWSWPSPSRSPKATTAGSCQRTAPVPAPPSSSGCASGPSPARQAGPPARPSSTHCER
ncbi:MAG: hypothetical protein AVDCRST_MAG75-630, partial [uncultured Propionibacteriaceae bacterium]